MEVKEKGEKIGIIEKCPRLANVGRRKKSSNIALHGTSEKGLPIFVRKQIFF